MKKILVILTLLLLLPLINAYDLFFGDDSGNVAKLNSSGNLKWKIDAFTYNNYGLSTDTNGDVYGGSYDGVIKKIDSSGSINWTFTNHTNIVNDVSFSDGYLYSAGKDLTVKKIYPNGTLVWSYNTGLNNYCIASNNLSVYVGTISSLIRLHPNGTLAWTYALGGNCRDLTIDSNNNAYIIIDQKLFSINSSGNLTYLYQALSFQGIALEASNNYLFVANNTKLLKTYLNFSLPPIWIYSDSKYAIRHIVVDDDGFIYITSDTKNVTKLDSSSKLVWNYTHSEATKFLALSNQAPLLHEVIVYLNDSDVNLTCSYPCLVNFTCESNATYSTYLNGTEINNSVIHDLKASYYNFSCNNSDLLQKSLFLTIEKGITTTILFLNGSESNLSLAWPAYSNATAISSSATSLLWLKRNGTHTANPEVTSIPVGFWDYYGETFGDENYTGSNSSHLYLNVSKAVPVLNLTIFPGLTITEGAYGNASCNESHGLPVSMTINGAAAGTSVAGIADVVGTYVLNCSTAGNTNYTASWTSSTLVVRDLCVGNFSNSLIVFCVVVLTLLCVSMMIIGKELPLPVIAWILFFAALCFVVYYVSNWSSLC